MREKLKKFKREFRKQLVIALMAAFGFLIALSWRDFISELVNHIISYFGLSGDVYVYKLISALLVTFIAVIGILIASKLNTNENEKK